MTEEDRVDISEEVNPPVPAHSQPPPTHAPPPPTPAGVPPAYSGAPSTHLPPPTSSGAPLPRVSLASSTSDDHARIAALEGTVNQLAASMTTNMAELFALLRGPNRASSSSTPPSGQGPTVDQTSWIPPTQVPENTDAPALPTTHTSTVHPFTSPFPPLPAPMAVPLLPAAFLSLDQVLSAPPPVSMPAPAAVYTVPPPMVFPAGNHLHRLAAYYGRLNRGIQVPPLSHFFPGPPHIIGSTLDGPSSDSDDAPAALPAVYAVTEEIPSGVHIRLAQENEELDNWTSVPHYSAVITDVLHSNPNLRHVDSNPLEECLGEPGPIYFGEGLDEDSQVPEIEESLHRLEDRHLTSLEPTEEINVGTENEPRTLKIETGLDPTQQARMIDFLTRVMNYGKEAWSTKKGRGEQSGEQTYNEPRKQQRLALWHYSSPDHRSVRRYPIWDFKNPSWYQNDQWRLRVHFRSLLLKPEHPRTFVDAFPNKAPGTPDPRMSKRHPGTGLHTPKNHQDHGTSFRLPFEACLGLPSESRPGKGTLSNRIQRSELIRWKVDVRASHHSFPTTLRIREIISPWAKQISQASRVTFQWSRTPLSKSSEHVSDEQRPQRSSNTSGHSGNIEKTPIADP
ncbi:hypothetical protein CDL15_Pgr027192 [Punica granatum]|uniref:Uncharacterized protein n=1 Tax=Punica granatum TaxID=22663 RepID=A0A218WJ33_PUNGR|nr:hypothetical protein CDL15_Pgr027192 [Punica granatum]